MYHLELKIVSVCPRKILMKMVKINGE